MIKKIIVVSTLIFVLMVGSMTDRSYAYIITNNSANTTSNTIKNSRSNTTRTVGDVVGSAVSGGMLSGVVFSSILCLVVAGRHKMVREAKAANDYLDRNNIEITRNDDIFVNSVVTKTRRD